MKTKVLAALSLVALTTCHRNVPARETLLIAGSSTTKAYLEPVVAAFSHENPSVSVISEGGGTIAAVLSLKQNAIDIAALSRMVDAEEDDLYLKDYQIARDGVAVVVSEANPVKALTFEQVKAIFEGRIKSWKTLGGPEAPIVVYRRPSTSHLHRSFVSMVLDGEEPALGAKVVESGKDLIATLGHEARGIGYMSMSRVKDVRALAIDGVPLTRATALSGRYPLSRAFYVAVYGSPSPLAERFISFTLGSEGQKLLAEDGLLPVR